MLGECTLLAIALSIRGGFCIIRGNFLPLPMEVDTFCPGQSGAVLFNGKAPNSAVFALHLEFGGAQRC